MADQWLDKWNQRYKEDEFAFGTEPNEYLKEQLGTFMPGSILFAAEGEGRNAVYAAKLGWKVSAFDISIEGKNKAERWAKDNGVTIDYRVGELPDLDYKKETFDAIVLIYAHFPADIKSKYHQLLDVLLKPGGVVIFEAFSKNHLEYRTKNPDVGGPRNLESLFSKEEIQGDFGNYEIIELVEEVIALKEGKYHVGQGSVIRFVGRKK